MLDLFIVCVPIPLLFHILFPIPNFFPIDFTKLNLVITLFHLYIVLFPSHFIFSSCSPLLVYQDTPL